MIKLIGLVTKTESRSLALLLGMMMVGLLLGCWRSHEPPVPKTHKALPVQMPPCVSLANRDLFADFKLRDPASLPGRLDQWSSGSQRLLRPASILLQDSGVQASDFRPGENASLFLFDPAGNLLSPPLAGLFPIPFGSRSARGLASLMGSDSITSISNDTLVARNKQALSDAVKNADTLAAIGHAPLQGDFQLALNVQAVMEKYGGVIRQRVQTLQLLVQLAGQPGQMNPALLQRLMSVEFQALLDLAGQTRNFVVDARLDPESLVLSFTLEARPSTALADTLSAPPVSAPDLAQFLDRTAFIKTQQSIRDLGKVTDAYMKYLSLAMGPQSEPALAKMRDELRQAAQKIGKTHMAVSLNLQPDGKFLYEGLVLSEDSEAYYELVRKKSLVWMNEGPLHDLYRQMGVDISVKEESETRKVHGWPVHRYALRATPNHFLPPAARTMLEKRFGSLTIEMARMGPYVLFSIGQHIEPLADRLFSHNQQPIDAMRDCPPGGVFYLDLDLLAAARSAHSMAVSQPSSAQPQAAPPPSIPPVTLCGYHQNGRAYYRLRIPKALLSQLVTYRPGGQPAPAPPATFPAPARPR